jgi:hypothetical protein
MKQLIFTLGLMLLTDTVMAQTDTLLSKKLVQQQLEAYNEHNIEKFLEVYSDTVKLYNYPNTLVAKGKESMRESYAGLFQNLPQLHCTLLNRMVFNDVVIDHERVVLQNGKPPIFAIAIYKIRNGKIEEVTFLQ